MTFFNDFQLKKQIQVDVQDEMKLENVFICYRGQIFSILDRRSLDFKNKSN